MSAILPSPLRSPSAASDKGVREMKRDAAGKSVSGARTTELPAPDVRTIREAARISQSQFAKLIGVNLRTL